MTKDTDSFDSENKTDIYSDFNENTKAFVFKYSLNFALLTTKLKISTERWNSDIFYIILVIPEFIFNTLNNITNEEKKTDFINNIKTKHIHEYCFFTINNKDLFVNLSFIKDSQILKLVFNELIKKKISYKELYSYYYIDSKNIKETIPTLISLKFGCPIIISENNKDYLVLKHNEFGSVELVDFVVDSTKVDTCFMNVRFDDEIVSHIKTLPIKNAKEYGGFFKIKKVEGNCKALKLFTLTLDKTFSGKNETIDLASSSYNFHSHPDKLYVKYNVKNGWVSAQDFQAILNFNKNVIFHTVCSLEGIYIVYLDSYWKEDNSNQNKLEISEFIKSNFVISRDGNITPNEYIHLVNKIRYKSKQIFHVQFLNWEQAYEKFKVEYPKEYSNCFYNDEARDNYESVKSSFSGE